MFRQMLTSLGRSMGLLGASFDLSGRSTQRMVQDSYLRTAAARYVRPGSAADDREALIRDAEAVFGPRDTWDNKPR